MTEPLAGVPIFVCRLRLVALGDRKAIVDLVERMRWMPLLGVTYFPCAHEPRCARLNVQELAALSRLSEEVRALVQSIPP